MIRIALLVMVLLAANLPLPSNAATDVAALLREAEASRSSDPEHFQEILLQLDSVKDDATTSQREQIAYLQAYHQGYLGRYDLALPLLRGLVATSANAEMRYRAGALMINGYAVTREFNEGLRLLDATLALSDQIKDQELRLHGLGVAAVM